MSLDTDYDTATELAARIRRGDVSPVALVDSCLERIENRNDELNAFVTVLEDEARERAQEAEQAVEAGEELGPMHGVPIAVKDLFDFKAGVRNTMGSKPFEEFVPDESATYVERLEEAGAIIVGKTNTPEFGHKGTTDNRVIGPTSTPFDLDRNAGGSSGGSAAAVADGLVPIAQGSDGGGSVRIPASFCGVYGFKASYGRVAQATRPDAFLSHTPTIHAGPLTRTVEDAALMLDVIAGRHRDDPFTLPEPDGKFAGAVGRSIDGLDIAYSPDLGLFHVDPEIRAAIDDAVDAFAEAGANVQETAVEFEYSTDDIQDAWRTFFQVLLADVELQVRESHGIALLEDHRETIDPLFASIVEAGREHSVIDLKRAEIVRTSVYETVQTLLAEYDLLVTPTLAVAPFEKSLVGPTEIDGVEVDPFIDWILSWVFNMTDHPAASIPAGFTAEGLPIGMQLVGRRFADGTVLSASRTLERLRPWHDSYTNR